MRSLYLILTCSLCFWAFSAESAPAGKIIRVRPGDGSFTRAAKNWRPGDTILLAPGEYRESFSTRARGKKILNGLTIKAEIPGSVVFRGDVPAPEFVPCGDGIWKAPWPALPETVFERDTLRALLYCSTRGGLDRNAGTWTYDEKEKCLYLRTTDSREPAKHTLTIGVTPRHGFNFYAAKAAEGPRNILLEGFSVTGFFSRGRYADQRIPSSQKKVPWGIVINRPQENVVIRDVTAFLNGMGIGFCVSSRNGIIENCRAWGNRSQHNRSGCGIGIFDENAHCILRNNIGADNSGNDIFLYGGPFAGSTGFDSNRAYGRIRVKGSKHKDFQVTNCIAGSFSHLSHPRHIRNSFTASYVENGELMTKENLFCRYEKNLVPEKVFADWENFDCRPMGGVPEAVAKRAPAPGSEKLFFLSPKGNDKADGRSIHTAFATFARAQKALVPGAELYITGPVKGNLVLKKLKNVAIRGRGVYASLIQGKITVENSSSIKLERLMPAELCIRNSKDVSVAHCYGKLQVSGAERVRLTHNHFTEAHMEKAPGSFVTANIFDRFSGESGALWSDYNAYGDKVPAGEKHSFKARALRGRKGSCRNAWEFDGKAIDGMPVGPFRRQKRNVALKLENLEFKSLTPETAVVEIKGNIPFTGTLFYGTTPQNNRKIEFSTSSCRHRVTLPGIVPGKKYFVRCEAKAEIPECFSNAELPNSLTSRSGGKKSGHFTAPLKYAAAKTYYVSPSGSDEGAGTRGEPFRTVGYAVGRLLPGDTLILRGGDYCEMVEIPVSGTRERPITLRGAEGEKVRFHGGIGSLLTDGIRIIGQKHLIFENMIFTGNGLSDEDGYSFAPIRVEGSENITFRRLLIGGATYTIGVWKSKNILIEDCVLAFGHGGLEIAGTSAVVRHCTFAYGGVNHIAFRNHGKEKILLENNIFTDLLNMKGSNALVHIHDPDVFTEKNNCFYLRMPWHERRIYGWNLAGGQLAEKNLPDQLSKFPFLGRRQTPYSTFVREFKRKSSSFSADPKLKIHPGFIVRYATLANWKKRWKKNQTASYAEHHRIGKTARLEFRNYLPQASEVNRRGCGPRNNK